MRTIQKRLLIVALLVIVVGTHAASAATIKVGLAQTVIDDTLAANRDKIIKFLGRAKSEGCQLVIFPEGALYWADVAKHKPSKAQVDAAMARIGQAADSQDMYVIFGVGYRLTDTGQYVNWGAVYDPDGRRILFYRKNAQVPQRFYVHDIPVNLSICSDRGYLEHSDLPCLVRNSQVIIDISGGHGGDDGRPDLRWIRYRPWATRTGAYVIVCNPVHHDTDFMGHSPWGGGSAIVRPDGSLQASRTYEPDVLVVEDIDTSKVTRTLADRRRRHPLLGPFWDMGAKLLKGAKVDLVPDVKPYQSAQRDISIAAAQIMCSMKISDNVRKITEYIHKAADAGADIVVFPELAVTGLWEHAVAAADQRDLDAALNRIRKEADSANVYAIVGMPYFVDGRRYNCAFAIGDDGAIKTRYAQISAGGDGLFEPGLSAGSMWFELKGVQSIVTIGSDANWVEVADLAAARGMYMHFHITSETYSSADATTLGRQRNLLMLMYAKYGAVVNAASGPDSPSGGISMIVSREGGHNKPAPPGVEYYLPYQTSVVQRVGSSETMIIATRRTQRSNDMDLARYWRNRNRRNRPQSGWYDWIKLGASLIRGGGH